MKNREKYAKEIKRIRQDGDFCTDFVLPKVFKSNDCSDDLSCVQCEMMQMLWLDEEAEEVDWSKVPVDTKILVKVCESDRWVKRHFAKYEDGKVYAFPHGSTSWTHRAEPIGYRYAKLAEE